MMTISNAGDGKEILLEVRDLKTYFFTDEGTSKAVDGVSFCVPVGKTLALVGESGCGKSVTSLSILQLVPEPTGKIVGGEIRFGNINLLDLSESQMQKIRGNRISMIFQEPMTALNPVFTIGNQIDETIKLHQDLSRQDRRAMSITLLRKVGIPEPEARLDTYPHHLSGGMRQRIMIAMALASNPSMLIADEPTTALDVTIQAQILALLNELQTQSNLSILLITHDLGVVAQTAHEVAVMYAGKIVEYADVQTLFGNPLHPYTQGLFLAIPRLGTTKITGKLATIPGQVSSPTNFPTGCRFHPRCPICKNDPKCITQEPPLVDYGRGHCAACWHIDQ
jgi:peptide/nickel transport system ATP-binding protein/oligopeptide transport system ATP-binding protein